MNFSFYKSILRSDMSIKIIPYTDKSFYITGNTRNHHNTIKLLGGKWRFLKQLNPKPHYSWLFGNTRRDQVQRWIDDLSLAQLLKKPSDDDISIVSSDTIISQSQVVYQRTEIFYLALTFILVLMMLNLYLYNRYNELLIALNSLEEVLIQHKLYSYPLFVPKSLFSQSAIGKELFNKLNISLLSHFGKEIISKYYSK